MESRTVGVLGAGQMGGGIAQVAATAGYEVVLADASLALAEKGKAKIAAILGKQVEKGKVTAELVSAIVGRIRPAAGPSELSECHLVVEAATENLELKLNLSQACDAAMNPRASVANTPSIISLTQLPRPTPHWPAVAIEERLAQLLVG